MRCTHVHRTLKSSSSPASPLLLACLLIHSYIHYTFQYVSKRNYSLLLSFVASFVSIHNKRHGADTNRHIASLWASVVQLPVVITVVVVFIIMLLMSLLLLSVVVFFLLLSKSPNSYFVFNFFLCVFRRRHHYSVYDSLKEEIVYSISVS